MPEPVIDELWFSVAQITPVKNGKDINGATASFYETGGKRFLVTNRHVVIDEMKNNRPDALRFRVHVDRSDLRRNQELLIPLYGQNRRASWLEHPEYKSGVDIVALNIDGILPSKYVIRFISSEDLYADDFIMRFVEDCAVLGYPLDFYDRTNNLPILRNAMVSSPYPIRFQGNHYFLVDSKLHKGSSGSPVFTKSQPGFKRRNGSESRGAGVGDRFLGIVSAQVSPEYANDQLDLYRVWFGHLVEQIASQRTNI